MLDYYYTLTLTLQTPVLTQSLGAMGFGYDMVMLKDGEVPVLPGSLIRGNLRETLERFAEILQENGQSKKAKELSLLIEGDSKILGWFGPKPLKTVQADDFLQTRAAFNFDYYWRCQPFTQSSTPRNRITLNPDTGTVEQGALVVIDAACSADRSLAFAGKIRACFDRADEAEKARQWLEKAVSYLSALGSLKGVGYGKILAVKVECEPVMPPDPARLSGSPTRIGLRLTLDRPFCLAKPRAPESNLFESEESISGGAIKAVLACRLDLEKIDKEEFCLDQLVFTHALPSKADVLDRRRVLPLSLAWVGDAWAKDKPNETIPQNLIDLALLPDDNANFVNTRTTQAAKFQIDWKPKEWKAAHQLVEALPGCKHHLAVHTAIDRQTGQSVEKQLFSLDCIEPQGMAWCMDIDLNAITQAEQRAEVLEKLLKALAHPLVGLGKTKAIATFAVQAKSFLDEAEIKPIDGTNYFIVCLQTPAVMFDDAQAQAIPACGDNNKLRECYQAYWDKVSKKSLIMLRFFAAQQREGGQFVWHHYLKKDNQNYHPFWLTEAGSVFVLESVEGKLDKAKQLLLNWRSLGLPQPDGEPSHQLWQHNPYIRENGYGEIRINDEIHDRYKAEIKEWS